MNGMSPASICSGSMPKRNQERIAIATCARVQKEMAKPRMASPCEKRK